MKTLKTFLVITIVSIINITYAQTPLIGIQFKIDSAFYSAFAKGNAQTLDQNIEELKQSTNEKAAYWAAYAEYYRAVFALKIEGKEKSEEIIKSAIKTLSDKKKKDSEDYALLAICQNFSMQFITNFINLGTMSATVGSNIGKAIKADTANLRAYLAAATVDFYTPEEYGGGQKTEELLLKTISLKASNSNDDWAPSWGKDQAYQILVSYYLKKDRKDDVKKYLDEGLVLFPNDYTLKQIAEKLK